MKRLIRNVFDQVFEHEMVAGVHLFRVGNYWYAFYLWWFIPICERVKA